MHIYTTSAHVSAVQQLMMGFDFLGDTLVFLPVVEIHIQLRKTLVLVLLPD